MIRLHVSLYLVFACELLASGQRQPGSPIRVGFVPGCGLSLHKLQEGQTHVSRVCHVHTVPEILHSSKVLRTAKLLPFPLGDGLRKAGLPSLRADRTTPFHDSMSLSDALHVFDEMKELNGDTHAQLMRLSELALRGAERGEGCSIKDVDELLSIAGNSALEAPFFQRILRAVCLLIERKKARRYDAEKILAEMDARGVPYGIGEFRAYVGVLLSDAKGGRGAAGDGKRVLDRMDRMGVTGDLGLYVSIMRLLSTLAGHGNASVDDGLEVVQHWRARRSTQARAAESGSRGGGRRSAAEGRGGEGGEGEAGLRRLLNAVMQLQAERGKREGEVGGGIQRVLSEMRGLGVGPDVVTLNAALAAIAHSAPRAAGARQRAESILAEVLSGGVQPDVVTFNTLIQVLLRSSGRERGGEMLADVLRVKECLGDYGLKPDTITFNSVLNAAAVSRERGGKVQMADVEAWLGEMEAEGVAVSTSTVNTVLKLAGGLAGDGLLGSRECVELVGRLKAQAKPDVQTYNLLLSAVAKAVSRRRGTLEDAGAVLAEMEREGVRLNAFTFNSLLHVLRTVAARGDAQVSVSDVEQVLHRMAEAGVQPDTVSLNSALSCVAALAKRGQACVADGERVEGLVMAGGGVQRDVISFTKRLEIAAGDVRHRRCGLEEAKKVLAEMEGAGVQPSLITYNVFLGAVGHAAGRGLAGVRDADQVLIWVQQAGLEADAFTVEGYARCARLQGRGRRGGGGGAGRGKAGEAVRRERERGMMKAWDLFRRMPERQRTPSLYAAVIDGFGSIGRGDTGVGMLDLAESHGLRPNLAMFNAALRCCTDIGRVQTVRTRMLAAGVKGDGATRKLLERAAEGADLTRNYNFFV